ncbi:hypothetical protein [Flavobacterium sp. XS2P14]|uniref:hypothetical protein n=1 Tax=Flavobacterium sp. XS2P14 TaxID=3401735 RepID=UPI003AAC1956
MSNEETKTLNIGLTVGYMLKVIKSGKVIAKFKNEFAAIRHGNYFEFLNLVDGPIPFMVTYNSGIVTTDNTPRKDECDFGGLIKSGPSLFIFYNNCLSEYGKIHDTDISTDTYGKVVLFEISLRMHANNDKLLNEREDLINVINKLSTFKNLGQLDTETLHLGRKFLNMIKHNKNQFPTWIDGLKAFEHAYEILIKHQLTIF